MRERHGTPSPLAIHRSARFWLICRRPLIPRLGAGDYMRPTDEGEPARGGRAIDEKVFPCSRRCVLSLLKRCSRPLIPFPRLVSASCSIPFRPLLAFSFSVPFSSRLSSRFSSRCSSHPVPRLVSCLVSNENSYIELLFGRTANKKDGGGRVSRPRSYCD